MHPQDLSEFPKESLPSAFNAMTLEDFLQGNIDRYEYVSSELILILPTCVEHGDISSNVQWYLQSHVRVNHLGRVYTADTGFRVGERVLMPDVAFISTSQLPDERSAIFLIPPELAIEVISPSDLQYHITEKALAYLEAGTRLVWIIEPFSKTVTVYRSETDIELLTRTDTLTGENIIEGFSCLVAQLFE